MGKYIKRLACAVLAILVNVFFLASAEFKPMLLDREEDYIIQAAATDNEQIPEVDIKGKSAILVEQTTGRILFEKNKSEKLAPASITKIMSLLLVFEALDKGQIKYEDKVTTSDYAASMGGTQIWLEPGEVMTVHELLKAVVVASANDATVALGEFIAGTNNAFVNMMNQRAQQLGMKNTVFKNATGLDADGHYTTAEDIAIMARELIKYKDITKYTTIWMDSLRGGKTELVNTNKLVRFYQGTTGLKTGTTDKAGVCLCATATRDNLSLISVVLGCSSSQDRFDASRQMLDYGFTNWEIAKINLKPQDIGIIKVKKGLQRSVMAEELGEKHVLVKKGRAKLLTTKIEKSTEINAPVEKGQTLGRVVVLDSGNEIVSYPLKSSGEIKRITFISVFLKLLKALFEM